MTVRISELSVRELKERFADPDAPISARVLGELERDPRRGAQALYAALSRRRAAQRSERQRLVSMMRAERALWRAGLRRVAGVDEAGMAPLAGPVVAAAVVFPPDIAPDTARDAAIAGVDDSKRVDPDRREELAARIRERAQGVAVGAAEVGDIERHNIYWAGILAMRRAVEALPEPPEHVLIDGRAIPDLPMAQDACAQGDARHFSIAAASIIAKTCRDRLMGELDRRYPGYGLARHKGYPTAEHQRAIRELGPCPAHRTSFAYFRELLGRCSPDFYELSRSLDEARGAAELEVVAGRIAAARDSLSGDELRKLRVLHQRRRRRR